MDQSFNTRIELRDMSLFKVKSQTSKNDRRSLLDIQRIIRAQKPFYAYIEVGSHLGGSLTSHLMDERCHRIVSIDARPPSQHDNRGPIFHYPDNSTERMLELLRKVVDPADLQKLETHDIDAADIRRVGLAGKFDLALVDGEHTDTAAFSDALSLLPYMAVNSIMMFHDAYITIDAILNFERTLQHLSFRHELQFLPDNVAVFLLGTTMSETATLRDSALNREVFVSDSREKISRAIAREFNARRRRERLAAQHS